MVDGSVKLPHTAPMTLRLAFMGTPVFATGCLTEIVAAGHDVAAVYSQPPRPAGRGQAVRPSPVHDLAESLGLEVRTPTSLKGDEELSAFAALDLDAAIVVAYGQILRPAILDAPRLGCFNVHASLLPRWRAATQIHRAIKEGTTNTRKKNMRMEPGLDTGPIVLSETVAIGPEDTAGSLHDRLAHVGAQLLPRALSAIERGTAVETPQDEDGVTYAHKIEKGEARIDWTRAAPDVDRHIRGLSPFPGAWFEIAGDKGPVRVKALASRLFVGAQAEHAPTPQSPTPGALVDAADGRMVVQCGSGAVELTRVQREGKRPQAGDEYLRGATARGALVVS